MKQSITVGDGHTARVVPGSGRQTFSHPQDAKPAPPSLYARSSNSSPGMSVVVVREFADLLKHLEEWRDLCDNALEPNSFYEPWFVLPALKAYGEGRDLEFVFIYGPDSGQKSKSSSLVGFFPLERRRRYRGLPVSVVSLWKHIHCYVCTPLIRRDRAQESLATFFNWLGGDGSAALMEFNFIVDSGPFHQQLVDYCNASLKLSYVKESYTRALLCRDTDPDQYVRSAVSAKHRKALKRQEARLAEHGSLEYAELEADGDVSGWIEDFLQLEASGWKGREGCALASNETDRTFFVTAATEAFRLGRLKMTALRLSGRTIALRCQLVAAPGAFIFKIAFDENYARYSPGMLLEIQNIRWLHANPEIRWMDSCAHSDNLMYNRLWNDRRVVFAVVVATGRRPGELLVSVLPFLRWLNRKLLRKSNPSSGN